jgi:hypothetical protein
MRLRNVVALSLVLPVAAGALLFTAAPLAARGHARPSPTTRLSTALTGKVRQVVLLRRAFHQDGFETCSILLGGRWRASRTRAVVGLGLDCALVDLDFDRSADLWVTGCDDGQQRVRRSDVWRFDARRRTYVFDSTLSSLDNLEVDPGARQLESGIDNCGCAGECFFHDTYEWRGGRLVRVARREQDCAGNESSVHVYREFARCGDSLCVVREVRGGEPDKAEYIRRQTGGHQFLDLAASSGGR